MLGIPNFLEKVIQKDKQSCNYFKQPTHYLFTSENQIKNSIYPLPSFARPCPKTPKHGFVESRKIETKEELLELWKQVRKIDPNGEIILGPNYRRVDFNAIYVNSGQLSIGPDNDGATGGKDSVIFPVSPQKFNQNFLKTIGVKKGDAVYIEAIYSTKDDYLDPVWNLTQMRGGPAIAGVAVDYVPKKTVVKEIINPSHDLLEWEKTAKNLKPGSVVYGRGYTLASHAAVHCILNKVPFMTSREPKIGEVLVPSNDQEAKLNVNQFRKGVRAALASAAKLEQVRAFNFALSVLHNWAYLKNSEHAAWLLGAASTMYAQVCLTLVLGEYRHGSGNEIKSLSNFSREGIYDKVMEDTTYFIPKLPKILKNFYADRWSDGFGGFPWATCAWYTYRLWQAIINTYEMKATNINDKRVFSLIDAINKTTNLAHNNGWWFNKFTDQSTLDFAADKPALVAFSSADIYYQLYKKINNINKVKDKFTMMKDVRPPFNKDKNGGIVWCAARVEDDIYAGDIYMYLDIWKEKGGDMSKQYKISEKDYKKFTKYAKKNGISLEEKNILLPLRKGKITLPTGKKVKVA